MNKLVEIFLNKRKYDRKFLIDINKSEHADLQGIDDMCNILKHIKDNRYKIVFVPDFDTDGIMAGTIGFAGLSELGFNAGLYRPTPSDGYGFRSEDIDEIIKEFPDVKAIITGDVGISCYEGVAYAKEKGLIVLITDHHKQLDDNNVLAADCVVNPNKKGETYFNKGICGAYVTYQVIEHFADLYADSFTLEQIHRLKVFAGFGTVSDAMPLIYENRNLIRESIAICKLVYCNNQTYFVDALTGSIPYVRAFRGLYSLLHGFHNAGKIQTSEDINEVFFGYYIAPAFNAVKRMNEDMTIPFSVFFATGQDNYVEDLYNINEQRKAIVDKYYRDMLKAEQKYAPYVYESEAPLGILGLLATKIINETGLPVLVVNNTEGKKYRGSGRAPSWYKGVSRLSDAGYFCAGHEGAFGIGLTDKSELKSVHAFLKYDSDEVLATLPPEVLEHEPDILITLDDSGDTSIDIPLFHEFTREIKEYGPFGVGFPEPEIEFRFKPSEGEWITMGSTKQHLKGVFNYGFTLILWNKAAELPEILSCEEITATGNINVNEYRGNTTVQFMAKELKTDED